MMRAMRYLLLADIHANLHALNAVLEDAGNRSWNKVLLLGDFLGYNACPNQIMEIIKDFDAAGKVAAAIRGNHDNLVLGLCNPDEFNYNARMAGLWSKDMLEASHLSWLEPLGEQYVIPEEQIAVCHLIENTPSAKRVPFPKYCIYYADDKADYEKSSALHFIGSHRFENGFYIKMAKRMIKRIL